MSIFSLFQMREKYGAHAIVLQMHVIIIIITITINKVPN
jgi:hypothetical protein